MPTRSADLLIGPRHGGRYLAAPTLPGRRLSLNKHSGNGAPVLGAAPTYFECRLVRVVAGGDRDVVIGELTDPVRGREPAGGMAVRLSAGSSRRAP